MTNFKLIAITPLANCHESFRKKLPAGEPNIFYNGYKIKLSADKQEVVKVKKPKKPVPKDLYQLKNGISLNISAIVGKNGSGKSTIFELFFYTIYAIYIEKQIDSKTILTTESGDIKYANRKFADQIEVFAKHLPNLKNDSATQLWQEILPDFIEFVNSNNIEFKAENYISPYLLVDAAVKNAKLKHDDASKYIITLEEEESAIKNGLAVSIIYESDGLVQELLFDRGIFRHNVFDQALQKSERVISIDEFKPEDFFYSICINYSHHGLNSNFIGTWINKLFHKNDAYKTPLVINPMRNEGNFNINSEQHLAKERLMANVLYDLVNSNKSKLLDKYSVKEFVFSAKIKTPPLLYPFKLEELKAYPLLKEIGIDNNTDNLPFFDYAISYLEHKINRINEHYHFTIFDITKKQSRAEQLQLFLKEDDTHITKKIRQTLNFLEHSLKNKEFWLTTDPTRIVLHPDKMLIWLKLSAKNLDSLKPYELIEYGLPGFFHIDFVLGRAASLPIYFSGLSSGEQQNILNINAILYHLYNINSVQIQDGSEQKESTAKKYGRIPYRNVNIILDEVELYYHPEMQRRVVSELISSFEKIKHKDTKGIQGINITILTHSPFILSDIPHQNILSLTDENSKSVLSESTKTFGGNIHEILMEQFFMDSTMGEHSMNIIQELINLYESARTADKKRQIKQLRKAYTTAKEKYKFVIKNVGEDVIREVLRNNLKYIKHIISEK